MTEYIEKPRYVCALGAFETILSINRAVPILHSGPGCGAKLESGIGTFNGCQGAGYISAHNLLCSNIGESEVVFGGDEKLSGIIENAIRVYDADLFVVLTGCTPEIVGDDVKETVSKFTDAGVPLVFAKTAGFKGSNLVGHEIVMDSIFEQFLRPTENINPKQVNIWASVPVYEPFWLGDYREIARLLRELGLEPNFVFGPDGGVEALQKVPQAAFNLLVSSWAGIQNMGTLQKLFGTPFLHWPEIPIGPTETAKFLRSVAEFAQIGNDTANQVIDRNERDYYYFIERAADELLKTRLLPRSFFTVANISYAVGLTKFLVNDMGLLPKAQFITDNPPEPFREKIRSEICNVDNDTEFKVVYSSGGGEAQDELRALSFEGKPLILGSGWEATFARNIGAYCLLLAGPLLDRMVLNRSYTGYYGALILLEDICSLVLNDYQR
ncbi:MAG: nitrogenase component 1 [Ethanoligenens sp.]